jgi:HAD superfamily hydrolase (TIGR01484 family)
MGIETKKLIVFDLDGTLAESKSAIDAEMAELLYYLLKEKMVAIISGGAFEQFDKQVVKRLKCDEAELKNLFLFPLSGASFYRYRGGEWQDVHLGALTEEERIRIRDAFSRVLAEPGYQMPTKTYGQIIEDRGSQITYSALGQEAPIEEKQKWQDEHDNRFEIVKALNSSLSEFDIKIGGMTSIDVTRRGINKYYGIEEMEKHLGVSRHEILFVGDALFYGGNDYAATLGGEQVVSVKGPADTKELIKQLIP